MNGCFSGYIFFRKSKEYEGNRAAAPLAFGVIWLMLLGARRLYIVLVSYVCAYPMRCSGVVLTPWPQRQSMWLCDMWPLLVLINPSMQQQNSFDFRAIAYVLQQWLGMIRIYSSSGVAVLVGYPVYRLFLDTQQSAYRIFLLFSICQRSRSFSFSFYSYGLCDTRTHSLIEYSEFRINTIMRD